MVFSGIPFNFCCVMNNNTKQEYCPLSIEIKGKLYYISTIDQQLALNRKIMEDKLDKI